MKKYLFLFAAMSLLALNSCIGNGQEEEPDPIEVGSFIYKVAANQNDFALDPVYGAFKLNVLLSEARSRDISITDIDEILKMTFRISGEDSNLCGVLFPSQMTLGLNESDGTYILEYDSLESWSSIGYDGKVIVNTGGKLLDELQQGEGWTISLDGKRKNDFYYLDASRTITVSEGASFGILRSDNPTGWDISVSDYKAVYSTLPNYPSDWDCDFKLNVKKSDGILNMENSHNAVFEFYGFASGDSFHGGTMEYEVLKDDPFVLMPTCNATYTGYMTESGTSIAKFTGEYNKESYPAPDTKFVWVKGSKNCSYKLTINYNGSSQTTEYEY